ncbi:hypothetical protein [Micromonospora endolithica]|uniref:hypothetical protein n=1 Tax=Micromonospora endolithica TaxID=230091 RepID=UPI0011ABD4E2|nr:hypothetical protein [Micromonospora endolithica]TWJ20743.1 hypothetical protein JD76_00842 [Micromonospora endolithica]
MPAWLAELLSQLPPAALVTLGVAYLVYRTVRHLLDSPLSIATIFGVLGGSERRKDAIEIVGKLCAEDEDQAAIEQHPSMPRRWAHRRRRKRR